MCKFLFIIAIYFYLNINKKNIKFFFSNSFINQLIYIKILKKIKIKNIKNIVCKFFKMLYSLKQLFYL